MLESRERASRKGHLRPLGPGVLEEELGLAPGDLPCLGLGPGSGERSPRTPGLEPVSWETFCVLISE